MFVVQGVVCGLKNWFLKARFNRGVRRMLWMFKKVRVHGDLCMRLGAKLGLLI